jgi:hypothetical protein
MGIGPTSVWILCSGTNAWAPAPWYTTNLVSGSWTNVTPFSSTYPALSNGTYTIWFATPGQGPVYYKVVTTNAAGGGP